MGILEDVYRDVKKAKRKIKRKAEREILGETKGERWNRRRMRLAQEAWSRYPGPLSHKEFMAEYLKRGKLRSKKQIKQKIGKLDKEAIKQGKKLTVDKLLDIFAEIDLRRVPKSETHFAQNINKYVPGGLHEYGEFFFGNTLHVPDYFVNTKIVFEYKIIRANTELHTALGQALIYSYKYDTVFLIIYDARHGYDEVDFTEDEHGFLLQHNIFIIKYPR
jgi:hypothetical protein